MVLCICPNPSIDCYAHVVRFELRGVNRIELLQEFPGGKGTHVALALAEMGVAVALMGFWGGASGKWISEACSSRSVMVDGVAVKENNRKCYTFKSKDSDLDTTELLERGPCISDRDWALFLQKLEACVHKFDIVSLSGSWPVGAPADASYQVAECCRLHQKKLFLDGSGRQLANALKSKFYGLHINEHESKDLFGSDNIDQIMDCLQDSVDLVALTQGERGLTLASKKGRVHALKQLEGVVCTVGSGDCLTAGIIYALLHNEEMDEMARYGAAFGAANCVNHDLGMLRKKHVEQFLSQTELKRK